MLLPGSPVYSPAVGPKGSFQCRLSVYPAGTSLAKHRIPLSAFVEVLPPESISEWSCEGVKVSISLLSQKGEVPRTKSETFTFSNKTKDRGWHDLFPGDDNWHLWAYMGSDGEFWLRAEVENLPFLEARSGNSTLEPFRHLDFSQELAVITFRLPGGSSPNVAVCGMPEK